MISDLSVLPTTPKPTPFGEIRPPPLPAEIAMIAAPSGVAFALSGNLEGGVDRAVFMTLGVGGRLV